MDVKKQRGHFILAILLVAIPAESASLKGSPVDPRYKEAIELVTKVTPLRQMFVQFDSISFDHPLNLAQVEATIDALSTKLASLRYASTIENLQPLTVVSDSVVLTVFQTVLPLSTSLQACKNLDLEPLALDNLPVALRTSLPILLHYEISVGTNSVICISQSYTLREDECLTDILNRTRNLTPFRQKDELRSYLLSNYVGAVAHLVLNGEEASFTSSPYGNSACIGLYNPHKLSSNASNDIRTLHEHFYLKLNAVYTDIFDYLDVIVSHLSDTVHSISSEEFALPIPKMTSEELVEEIKGILPSYLPNLPSKIPIFQDFASFFSRALKDCPDFVLGNLTVNEIRLLPRRQLKILFSSLQQFRQKLTRRLAEYMKIFNLYEQSFYLPDTLLFVPEQEPSSFMYMVKSLIPTLDENLLTEIFVMVQNEKMSLLQDVNFLVKNNTALYHLSRSEFSKISRGQWRRYSSSAGINDATEKKESQLKFLHNYHRKSEVLYKKEDTKPFLADPTELQGNGNSLARLLQSKSLTTLLGSESQNNTFRTRHKRSWGSFWGGLFNLGTQEDIDKIYAHELAIGNNELSISNALRNITDSNSHLLNSVQTVTASVNSLLTREKNLFSSLQAVMRHEEISLEEVNAMFTTLDRSTTLVSEYLTLQAQTALLFSTIQRLQSLVLSALSGFLDVSQIPTSVLKPFLSSGLRISVSLVKTTFKYGPEGYRLEFHVPRLTKPYTVYHIQTIPFWADGVWLELSLPRFMVMNEIHETAVYQEITDVCQLVSDNYVCPPDMLHISHKTDEDSCSYQLVISTLTNSELDLKRCLSVGVRKLESQRFLVKDQGLVISSPTVDQVRYHCTNSDLNQAIPVQIGVNKFPVFPGCHYETNQLQVRNLPGVSKHIEGTNSDFGLSIIRDLDSLSTLLTDQLPAGTNLSTLKTDLSRYESNLALADRSVDKLAQQVNQLDSIRTLSEFSPLSLDLTRPFHTSNWVAVMFWIMTIMAILLVWSVIRHFSWYTRSTSKAYTWLAGGCTDLLSRNWRRSQSGAADSTWEVRWNTSQLTIPEIQSVDQELSQPLASEGSVPTPDSFTPARTSPAGEPWTSVKGTYGNWQLRAILHDNDGQPFAVYYNPRTRKVTDKVGQSLGLQGPQESEIKSFYSIVQSLKIPPLVKDQEGNFRHKVLPFLYFNQKLGTWMNEQNQSSVPGLPAPPGLKLYRPPPRDEPVSQESEMWA